MMDPQHLPWKRVENPYGREDHVRLTPREHPSPTGINGRCESIVDIAPIGIECVDRQHDDERKLDVWNLARDDSRWTKGNPRKESYDWAVAGRCDCRLHVTRRRRLH